MAGEIILILSVRARGPRISLQRVPGARAFSRLARLRVQGAWLEDYVAVRKIIQSIGRYVRDLVVNVAIKCLAVLNN